MKDLAELIVRWQLTLDVSEDQMSPELRDMVKDTIKCLRRLRELERGCNIPPIAR
jgi:hypothetical protein